MLNRPLLTNREIEIIEYLSQGLTHKTIAKKMLISRTGFEFMLHQLRTRLGCSNSTHLVSWYYENFKINEQNIDSQKKKAG
jgi:DNA-binding CsgD family transcriptional regulator